MKILLIITLYFSTIVAKDNITITNTSGIVFILTCLFLMSYLYRSHKIISRQKSTILATSKSLQTIQRIGHLGNWEWDVTTNDITWSDEIYQIFGLNPQQFNPDYNSFLATAHPDDREKVTQAINTALADLSTFHVVHKIIKPGGEIRYVVEEGEVEVDENKNPIKMLGIVQDITEQKMAREEINKLLKAISQIEDTVVITDKSGIITYINQAFKNQTGYTEEDVFGQTLRLVKSNVHDRTFYKELWSAIASGKSYRKTITNKKKNGDLYYEDKSITPLKDEQEKIIGYIATGKDVTAEMLLHQELERIATTDKLTGIYNRHKFEELFALESERSRRYLSPLSMLIIDIDHFKSVNDTYGHDAGDEVLKQLAQLVQGNIRLLDIFTRWGGEEFLVLCPNTDLDNIKILAEKLRSCVDSAEFPIVNNVTISIGISSFSANDSFSDFFKRVDQGLYHAKKHGRNQIGFV